MLSHKNIPLELLIRCPIQWEEFFLEMDTQNRMQELHDALLELPASGVRDARRARCLGRLNRLSEAKQVLLYHRNEPLCVAWYVAVVVLEGGEQAVRQVLTAHQPNWEMKSELTDLEAKYRLHLSRGVGFATLKMRTASQAEFIKCLQYADALGDKNARRIAFMESARTSLFSDELDQAFSVYKQVLSEVQAGILAHDVCVEALIGLSWFLGRDGAVLPAWGQYLLKALRLQRPAGPMPQVPEDIDYPKAALVLERLASLTQLFNEDLPMFFAQEVAAARMKIAGPLLETSSFRSPDEITDLICQLARGLALSMLHKKEGIEVVLGALRHPATGVSVLVMAHFASVVQVYANLPWVERGSEFLNAKRVLLAQFQHLKGGQRDWLLWWMEHFTPTALYLLVESHVDLRSYQRRFMVVSQDRVMRDGMKVQKYPKKFMNAHLAEFLSGKVIPLEKRAQAHRHRQVVLQNGRPFVVFEQILSQLR